MLEGSLGATDHRGSYTDSLILRWSKQKPVFCLCFIKYNHHNRVHMPHHPLLTLPSKLVFTLTPILFTYSFAPHFASLHFYLLNPSAFLYPLASLPSIWSQCYTNNLSDCAEVCTLKIGKHERGSSVSPNYTVQRLKLYQENYRWLEKILEKGELSLHPQGAIFSCFDKIYD